uniref:Uncharacterized protein n=1 Tax=Stomoxys calcitrans TaxID=35570 RepID=A0A1I8NZX0_STOCA
MPTNFDSCLERLCERPLQCRFPPCNCEKCQERRIDNDETDSEEEDGGGCWNLSTETESEEFHCRDNKPRICLPTNINAALCDIFGVIAFIIMTSVTLWLMVWHYMWRFGVYIYRSGRKTQYIALALLSMLFLCIVFHSIGGCTMKTQHKEKIKTSCVCNDVKGNEPKTTPTNEKQRQRGGANEMQHSHGTHTKLDPEHIKEECKKKKSSDSLCALCGKFHKDSLVKSKTEMSDHEVRRIFEKFKLYSMPSEWKSPPAIIVLLKDYLVDFFGGWQ